MEKKNRGYGIRKKYLFYTELLLLLSLLFSSLCVWIYMQKNMTEAIIGKYEFMTEKMGLALDNLYQTSDRVTADCIMNSIVQKSLLSEELTDIEKNSLSKYFAYIGMEQVEEYCYVDNKENVYTHSYSKISYADFKESALAATLGDNYAKTKWIWTQDTLFSDGKPALFIGRYVRSLEYSHEPGMLFLKMKPEFLGGILEAETDMLKEIAVGIVNEDGQFCALWMPKGYSLSKEENDRIRELADTKSGGMVAVSEKLPGGILSAYRHKDNGILAFTFVPDRVLNSGWKQVLLALGIIYLVVAFIAVNVSLHFSKRFTNPIRYISDVMSSFDGNNFDHIIELQTNTELDQIGHSYNSMLENIEWLLSEIKEQQEELRKSELNTLLAQINPHFLYNTLDTIYMLARLNKEETTMKMIQELSKYLRLCLSKGSDMVTVADELENVKSYMEIQRIRNTDLFTYKVDCRIDAESTKVLKLILQPLVENSIKYGFCDIFVGGIITITIYEENEEIIFEVFNNGKPMDKKIEIFLNGLMNLSVMEMKACFQEKDYGFGVLNVITRLRLRYKDDICFYYRAGKDGTCCTVRLPKKS